jgi:S1-C subfamily serine protease
VTFDYDKLTMALVPDAAYSEPDTYERAGLFLISNGGKCLIFDVRANTPAAQAGLLKGDAIDSVDGVPASSMNLQAVRAAFTRPAGTIVKLGIVGKDGTKARGRPHACGFRLVVYRREARELVARLRRHDASGHDRLAQLAQAQ